MVQQIFEMIIIIIDIILFLMGAVFFLIAVPAYNRILKGEVKEIIKYFLISYTLLFLFFAFDTVVDFGLIKISISIIEVIERITSLVAFIFAIVASVLLTKFSKTYGFAAVEKEIMDFFNTEKHKKEGGGGSREGLNDPTRIQKPGQ